MAFAYKIKRQRRKTMALHVLEDASVEVRVPTWLAKAEIERFIKARSAWVLQQLQQRQLLFASPKAAMTSPLVTISPLLSPASHLRSLDLVRSQKADVEASLDQTLKHMDELQKAVDRAGQPDMVRRWLEGAWLWAWR